jgi:hypothetical protein
MPGNWDYYQTLNPGTSRVEWPTGPLNLGNAEHAKWLEAWVVQRSTGASQSTTEKVFPVPGRWTAVGIPPGWINGGFQTGPAIGIALLASHDANANTDETYWWVDLIDLE